MQPTDQAIAAIRNAVAAYIAYVESEDCHEDVVGDYENAIFEAAVNAFGGADVWERITDALMRDTPPK